MTRSLLVFLGSALTGTSANRSGGADPRSARDVMRELGDRIDLILDGGPAAGELPSTVVDVTGDRPTVLRRGAITDAALFVEPIPPADAGSIKKDGP
jgi:L-threonylcarbamoyladenylate synthase